MNEMIIQIDELIKNLKEQSQAQSDDINLLANCGSILEIIENLEIAKELINVSKDQYNTIF